MAKKEKHKASLRGFTSTNEDYKTNDNGELVFRTPTSESGVKQLNEYAEEILDCPDGEVPYLVITVLEDEASNGAEMVRITVRYGEPYTPKKGKGKKKKKK